MLRQLAALLLCANLALPVIAEEVALDPVVLAEKVTIHRDKYGTPHIIGETDEMNARTLPKVTMPNRSGFILMYPSPGR